MEFFTISLLNGISYGLLLFMLSSGLTLIFSMMGVLNFAHASFYMLGAYFAYTISSWIGFWPALVLAPLLVGLLGALFERYGLRRCTSSATCRAAVHLRPVVRHPRAGAADLGPLPVGTPTALPAGVHRGSSRGPLFTLYGTQFPAYRGFMMLVALADAGGDLAAADAHPHRPGDPGRADPSRHGGGARPQRAARLHAGVRRRLRAGRPGRRDRRQRLRHRAGMARTVGPIIFVVVVVGGMGSLAGAFVASLLIGCCRPSRWRWLSARDAAVKRSGLNGRRRNLRLPAAEAHRFRRSRRSCPTCCWC
jgi:branched-chain amino acid transport system permease protein